MKKLKIRSNTYPANTQEVTEKTWEAMKAKGLASRFVVVESVMQPTNPPPEVEETIKKNKK